MLKSLILPAFLAMSAVNVHDVRAGIAIDLLEGTIDGAKISSLTMESVTDKYGRPSKSWNTQEASGACYDKNGLHFIFIRQGENLGSYITISLVEQQGSPCYYSPYKGKLTEDVDANWKLKRFREKFPGFELIKEIPEAGVYRFASPKTKLDIDVDSAGFLNTITIGNK